MITVTSFRELINEVCRINGISQAELGRRMGYNKPQSFSRKVSNGWFYYDELCLLAQMLGANVNLQFDFSIGDTNSVRIAHKAEAAAEN